MAADGAHLWLPTGAYPARDLRSDPGTKDVRVTPAPCRDLMTRKANPVTVGGVVCGTWARSAGELTVTWLDQRPRPDEAIKAEAARVAGLTGATRSAVGPPASASPPPLG